MIGCAFNVITIKYRSNDEICSNIRGVFNNFSKICIKWEIIREIDERNFQTFPDKEKGQKYQDFACCQKFKE